MKDAVMGIDFGTCNIKVSFYDENTHRVRQLKIDKSDDTSDRKVPNAIIYKQREDYHIGSTALKKRYSQPQDVAERIKRKLELEHWSHDFPTGGFTLTAEEITTDIFCCIRKAIEEQGRGIRSAVITVPVCFTELQKGKILHAAADAGIPVTDTLTEPVAALFSVDELFEDPDTDNEFNVVIFDFGGATLDLCLCSVICGGGEIEIQVEASSGVRLGGTDLTEMIYQDCIYPKHQKLIDAEFQLDTLKRLEAELFEFTDNLKTELFVDEADEVEGYSILPYTAEALEVHLTLDEVLRCFAAHGVDKQIRHALDELFEDSEQIMKEDVNMVKAFGGTSRINYFRELLGDYFSEADFEMDDYDADTAYSAVADGAARYLGILQEEDSPIVIHNAVPFHIGVEQDGVFRSVVQRGAKYGVFSPSRNLSKLLREDGEWKISLYQSFVRDPGPVTGTDGAVYLGSVALERNMYTDFTRILYKFGVDHSGRIVGRFYEVGADNEPVLREELEIAVGG